MLGGNVNFCFDEIAGYLALPWAFDQDAPKNHVHQSELFNV